MISLAQATNSSFLSTSFYFKILITIGVIYIVKYYLFPLVVKTPMYNTLKIFVENNKDNLQFSLLLTCLLDFRFVFKLTLFNLFIESIIFGITFVIIFFLNDSNAQKRVYAT